MNSKILIPGVLVLLVGALGFFMLGGNQTKTTETQTTETPSSTETTATEEMNVGKIEVMVTESGFEPATITIKAGSRVVWTNKSGTTVTVNSLPHPTHNLYPILNLGSFGDGSSVEVTFTEAGTFEYHNHLNSAQTGTVVVE